MGKIEKRRGLNSIKSIECNVQWPAMAAQHPIQRWAPLNALSVPVSAERKGRSKPFERLTFIRQSPYYTQSKAKHKVAPTKIGAIGQGRRQRKGKRQKEAIKLGKAKNQ